MSGQRHTQLPAALAAYNDGRDYAKANLLEIPKINLPKGGGALKPIYKVNVVIWNRTILVHRKKARSKALQRSLLP